MLALELGFEDGRVDHCEVALPCEIGRGAACNLRIQGWRVAKRHMRFEMRDSGVFLEDFGSLSGTILNGARVFRHGPLKLGDEIIVGHCLLRIKAIRPRPGGARQSGPDAWADGDLRRGHHPETQPPLRETAAPPATAAIGSLALGGGQADASQASPMDESQAPDGMDGHTPCTQRSALFVEQARRLRAALLDALDLRRHDIAGMDDASLRKEAEQLLQAFMAKDTLLPPQLDPQMLCKHIVDEAVGLGPLEALLEDPAVSEIMVNRYDEIYVETRGRLHRHHAVFSSEAAVLGVIDRIVAPIGRRVDESSPMVDARLRDGSRVNAVIPPVALRGASITIRKFFLHRPSMPDLVGMGSLDMPMSRFLMACVRLKKNIVVSGGTGSGKTTLLNALSNGIPETERIITIEDAAELRLNHGHLVSLEARPANLEGRGRIEIRDLVRNALRMRPDRIVVGECRGAEAFDMLAAMNTGHEGSLTTLHANSPRDALGRLETMILMAGMDLPLAVVREHIASSIDIIVQQARLHDGSRRLLSITEITGMESGRIQMQELFCFESGPVAGFRGCGVIPDWVVSRYAADPEVDGSLFSGFSVLPAGRPAGAAEGIPC